MKISIFIAFFLVLNLQANFNASFKCSKAKSVMEKLICSDKKLATEDSKLLKTYRKVKRGLPKWRVKKLLKSQRRWLRDRKKLCDIPEVFIEDENQEVIGCLIGIYRARNAELKKMIKKKKPKSIKKKKSEKSKKEKKVVNYEGYYSIFDTVTLQNGEDEYLESYIKIKKDKENYRVSFLIYGKSGNSCEVNDIVMKERENRLSYKEEKCNLIVKKGKNNLKIEDKNSNCSKLFKCAYDIKLDGFKFTIF